MTQCELCGTDSDSLVETKVSGAKLMVCSSCSELGTVIEKEKTENSSTKYDTGSSENNKNKNRNNKTHNQNSGSKNQNKQDDENPFDGVNELALEFGDIIRSKRNDLGLDREELSKDLGIKQSHLRSIENENTKPSVDLQEKIEGRLDVDLGLDDDLGL